MLAATNTGVEMPVFYLELLYQKRISRLIKFSRSIPHKPIAVSDGAIPELFPVVTGHLPLYLTPSTLLSLALTNHQISEIVLPLLYQHLILKNENVLRVLGRLLDEPAFGKFVRELHILSNLPNIRYRPGFFDKLEEVIVAGSLPHMHTLNIGSLFSWSQEGHYLSPGHLGKPSADFFLLI